MKMVKNIVNGSSLFGEKVQKIPPKGDVLSFYESGIDHDILNRKRYLSNH